MIKYIILVLIFVSSSHSQENMKIEYSKLSDTLHTCKISIGMVDSMYSFIEDELSFVDFNDCNNCDSRAHLIAAILANNFPGAEMGKVWLFADFKLASKSELYKFKPNVYLAFENECKTWGFHVAPVVIVQHGKGIDTFVIDHSTQKTPVKLDNWAEKLVQKNGRALIVIKDKKYYNFPDDKKNKFIDTISSWIDKGNKYLYDNEYKRSLDKVLLTRYGFWEPWIYRKHFSELEKLLGKE